MRTLYLWATVIGFIAPNILVAIESFQTGNILLWLDPLATMEGMFATRISTIFMIDLLLVVLFFFVWSHREAKRYQMGHPWWVWLLTMLFGIAGGFPLFLYLREGHLDDQQRTA